MEIKNIILAFTFLQTPFSPKTFSPDQKLFRLGNRLENGEDYQDEFVNEETQVAVVKAKNFLESFCIKDIVIKIKEGVVVFYPNWKDFSLSHYVNFLSAEIQVLASAFIPNVHGIFGEIRTSELSDDEDEVILYNSPLNNLLPIFNSFGVKSLVKAVIEDFSFGDIEAIKFSLFEFGEEPDSITFNDHSEVFESTLEYRGFTIVHEVLSSNYSLWAVIGKEGFVSARYDSLPEAFLAVNCLLP